MPLPDMESHWDPFATNASTVHEPTSVSNDELYLTWFQTADTGEGAVVGVPISVSVCRADQAFVMPAPWVVVGACST